LSEAKGRVKRDHKGFLAASAVLVWLAAFQAPCAHADEAPPPPSEESRGKSVAKFVAGGIVGFAAHEAGHVGFDLAFDAHPGVKGIRYAGIPFFAITHRHNLPRRQEFAISSAGFWMQHASSEWLLSRHPRLHWEHAPWDKGGFAFDVLTSAMYAGAALTRSGPYERDTRGMAASLGVDEHWIGAMVLAPAALDTYRYYHPSAGWAKWTSRAVKVGLVLLVLK
jgi:hypothetical protein